MSGMEQQSLCKLSRRDVCLSELCLLRTSYDCGGRTTWLHFVSISKLRHCGWWGSFRFIQSRPSVVYNTWIIPYDIALIRVYISSADQIVAALIKKQVLSQVQNERYWILPTVS